MSMFCLDVRHWNSYIRVKLTANPSLSATSATSPAILCERDGVIATVRLSNPSKQNAVTAAMWQQLRTTMETLHTDASLRCIVLRGEGRHFAAGGDIEEFLSLRNTRAQAESYHAAVGSALESITACQHPTLALIEGSCIGGGLEIAAQCDLRIAAESAKFGAPIMKLGFPMAQRELANLLALAGSATMLEILLEGRLLRASEAYLRGLVTRVVADSQIEEEAYASARRIASGAPLVARQHKQLVRRLSVNDTASQVNGMFDQWACLESHDYREGLAAFLAKRMPEFRGN